MFRFVLRASLAASLLAGALASAGPASAAVATPAAAPQLLSTPLGSLFGNDAPGPVPAKAGQAQAQAAASGCVSASYYATSFNTSLGPNWTSLDARQHQYQACAVLGTWGTGSAMHISYQANGGQTIALHPSLCGNAGSVASSVWYKTDKGWVWSGGTANPVWNTSC